MVLEPEYLYPAASFLVGCFLVWWLMRARLALLLSEARMTFSKEQDVLTLKNEHIEKALADLERRLISAPDTFTEIELSNTNPNRFNCVNGNVNDVSFPKDVPIDAIPSGSNLFVSYKILSLSDGSNEYVHKKHDIHVVCGGEVFSFSVRPKSNSQSSIVRMGDPNKKYLEENAKLLGEMSKEELYVYLIMTAINNDYKGNITATQVTSPVPLVTRDAKIVPIRELTMNGAGLRLKEYQIETRPGQVIQKESLIRPEISEAMLSIAIHPAKAGDDGKTRLFVVESKI